jgi:hypothetical protein
MNWVLDWLDLKIFKTKQDTSKNDVHKSVIGKKSVFNLEIKKIFDLSADETNNQILKTLIIM